MGWNMINQVYQWIFKVISWFCLFLFRLISQAYFPISLRLSFLLRGFHVNEINQPPFVIKDTHTHTHASQKEDFPFTCKPLLGYYKNMLKCWSEPASQEMLLFLCPEKWQSEWLSVAENRFIYKGTCLSELSQPLFIPYW